MIAPTFGTAPVTRSRPLRKRRASLVTARAALGHQNDPRHALERDVAMPDGERLHRHPAHGMTHEHRAAQVEALDDAPHIFGEVVDRVARVAHGRLAMTASVESERSEASRRNRVELLGPRS